MKSVELHRIRAMSARADLTFDYLSPFKREDIVKENGEHYFFGLSGIKWKVSRNYDVCLRFFQRNASFSERQQSDGV